MNTPEPAPRPSVRELKRGVAAATACASGTLGALWLTFGVLITPGGQRPGEACRPDLYPGTYADALGPAHFAATVLIAFAAVWLNARRSPTQRPALTAILAAAAVVAFAAIGLAAPSLVEWPAVAALVSSIPVAFGFAVGALIHTVVVHRREPDPAVRWRRHAQVAEFGVWVALLFGVPATLAASWIHGAGLFCF